MPINENMVQEIVQEVMAKMQIADAPTGKHGIFKEMNDAIEAAKKSQLIVKKMSIHFRCFMLFLRVLSCCFCLFFSFFIPIIVSDAKNTSSTDLTVQTADRMYCLF